MADFPVCLKKKAGGFGVSVLRGTWVLLHAVHFFQTYREVGELEIALSFALLQMSLGHWSWKYLTGDLPRPAQPFREGHDAPPGR